MNHGVTLDESTELMEITQEMNVYHMTRMYDLNKLTETLEIDKIHLALKSCKGNRTQAANMLGLKRTSLLAKMKKYGIT
jgi:DNA-binding protein Fis